MPNGSTAPTFAVVTKPNNDGMPTTCRLATVGAGDIPHTAQADGAGNDIYVIFL